MRHLLLLLTLLPCYLSAGEGGAMFNPRVSTRLVALNQPVRVVFTTPLPTVDGIDPLSTIRSALEQPGAGDDWRLVGSIAVERDEKIRTLRSSYLLVPRRSGTLELPAIQVRWLPGADLARFGTVQVTPNLAAGSRQLPLPGELQAVGGHRWETSQADLQAATGINATTTAEGEVVLIPRNGLTLVLRGGVLAEARIAAPRISLATARASYTGRWGDPLQEEPTAITWILGWVRITATADDTGGHTLRLVHEQIEARLARAAVQQEVLGLLDGPTAPANAPVATPEGPSQTDVEREFLRRMSEGQP